ncbi:DNA-directed DNA polymerase gamma mip1 [Venturia effusa]|uniref:DNA-directed DNA polymerase n=1 Tax=Venturia effusa TaxID=50376 RepID=A0A517LKM3_9PEZI|nr:DNA-directed DNA polymerase gamma mip1 [Venturia effusa]
MRPFQRGKLLSNLSRKHRAFIETSFPPNGRHPPTRYYATEVAGNVDDGCRASLSVPSQARYNEINVQQLSDHMHGQIFKNGSAQPPLELIQLSKDHLTRHELLGKTQDAAPPVAFDMPHLQGQTLDEHFQRLGMDAAEPYLSMAKKFATANCPPRPRKWVKRSGWTKYYEDGRTEAVGAPNDTLLTFDTEVMWKETSFACMACAASPTAWYAWLSPWLLGESKTDRHLIPLGDAKQPRIVIGHNIGYDRARIAEEYNIEQSKNFFVDTMSLHVAVNGMCSRQRPTWMKHRKNRELRDEIASSEDSTELSILLESGKLSDEEEELWVGRSSVNSLRDVAKFHCGITIDKQQREFFGELDRDGVVERLDELLDYCAADVDITHRVYRKVFPNYLETCPHPVSFAALRHMSAEILPVTKGWETYIANAEATYQKLNIGVIDRLTKLANRALKLRKKPAEFENDPWLSQLDWSGQEIRMTGGKKGEKKRPAAKQKLPGMPNWWKDLHPTAASPINLTVRTRIAPILLRLAWEGYPLVWSDVHGWTYKVPLDEVFRLHEKRLQAADMSEDTNLKLKDDRQHQYFKLPHKDGPQARCTNPLAKSYLQYMEKGILTSEYPYAKAALEMNASCSYWVSARARIMNQMMVYADEAKGPLETKKRRTKNSVGFILPQIIPMGTITRRAVENTWLTAANAKANRVGSELKSIVTAPPGFAFVGADVDSQELWIASLIGDAQFKLHGGNAIGFMTLEGTKAAGTDLHSRTAKILGISRNDAKVFNYGRIYGAGQKFAIQLLRQFNPGISEQEASDTASALYQDTKGKKGSRKILHERSFWRGGTESLVFNRLEDFAEQSRPRTPVLGAGITEALMRQYISKGGFLTSRINWAIQSSGVDYLHLLIVSMDYLIRRFNLTARLSLTVHDEIRYLCKEEEKYKVAMAMQVANVWTRAMFAQQLGIEDLPQACAYFSAVDIDHVLRKEVDMECVTPSHTTKIAPGESIDIVQLLQKGTQAYLDPAIVPIEPPKTQDYEYEARVPVIKELDDKSDIFYLRAQITADDGELANIIKEKRLAENPPSPPMENKEKLPRKRRQTKKEKEEEARLKELYGKEQGRQRVHYQNQPQWLVPAGLPGHGQGQGASRPWEMMKKRTGITVKPVYGSGRNDGVQWFV